MLTDPDATQFIVPIEPQPEGFLADDDDPYVPVDENFDEIKSPYAVGDKVPVREEWRLYDWGEHSTVIQYNDYSTKCFNEKMLCPIGNWQPPETMPDWAARTWRRVTGVEASKDQMWDGDVMISDDWVWVITVEPWDES